MVTGGSQLILETHSWLVGCQEGDETKYMALYIYTWDLFFR